MILLVLALAAQADQSHAPPPDEDEPPAAIPAPGTPPPPPTVRPGPPPTPAAPPAPPPGWRPVPGTAAAPAPTATPTVATRRMPDQRVPDERAVALGGSLGGGSSASVDALFRFSRSTILDLGAGVVLDPEDELAPVSNRLLLGLSWQPGMATGRHGIFGRAGLGWAERDAGEALAMAGYAWRLVPHESPVTVELEAAPGLIYREEGPRGGEWAALAIFARVGMHVWLR